MGYLLLKLRYSINEFILYDADNRLWLRIAIPADNPNAVLPWLNGWAWLNGHELFALFKHQNLLWLSIESEHIQVTSDLLCSWNALNETRRFELLLKGQVIKSVTYIVKEYNFTVRAFTLWEEEDTDFLLWVHNVLRMPERKAVLLEEWH